MNSPNEFQYIHADSALNLMSQAYHASIDYLAKGRDIDVVPNESAISNLSIFDEDFPSLMSSGSDVLKLLSEYGGAGTVRYGCGRYFGFVNGGVLPVSLAARWLADVWDQNSALYKMSPIASKLETLCEKWLLSIFNLPRDAACGFVSGSSMASLVALVAARNHILNKLDWDVSSKGLFGAPLIKVFMSEYAHSSVYKALSIMGIGREQIVKVRGDGKGRIDPAFIPELDSQSIFVCQAGEVNTGAFDPFVDICQAARKVGAWVHVDGAFGLWAAASKYRNHLYKGAEMADSWSVDAHKTLNIPYDSGIVICRDRNHMIEAMRSSATYLAFTENRDGMLLTPEMSRRARVIEVWAALKTLGRSGLEQLIETLCKNASLLAEMLRNSGFYVLNDVEFNQILVSCATSDETARLLVEIQRSGQIWCGGTSWDGSPAIRISVCDWTTDFEDLSVAHETFVTCREAVIKGANYETESCK